MPLSALRAHRGAIVLPDILITSELSLMRPLSNGGVATWVFRAFGSAASGLVAANMLLYQLVDLATYPTLVAPYMENAGLWSMSWLGPVSPTRALTNQSLSLLAERVARSLVRF